MIYFSFCRIISWCLFPSQILSLCLCRGRMPAVLWISTAFLVTFNTLSKSKKSTTKKQPQQRRVQVDTRLLDGLQINVWWLMMVDHCFPCAFFRHSHFCSFWKFFSKQKCGVVTSRAAEQCIRSCQTRSLSGRQGRWRYGRWVIFQQTFHAITTTLFCCRDNGLTFCTNRGCCHIPRTTGTTNQEWSAAGSHSSVSTMSVVAKLSLVERWWLFCCRLSLSSSLLSSSSSSSLWTMFFLRGGDFSLVWRWLFIITINRSPLFFLLLLANYECIWTPTMADGFGTIIWFNLMAGSC